MSDKKTLNESMYDGLTDKGKDSSIVYFGKHPTFGLVTNCISTGVPSLDRIIAKDTSGRWGIPCGRTSFISGKPGCLSGNTRLLIKIGKNGGRYYSLEDAYHKFNCIPRETVDKKNINRFWNGGYQISIPSLLKDGTINNSPISAIVKSGEKTTYILSTKTKKIRATGDHRFKVKLHSKADNEQYVKLKDLSIGDKILCKNTRCISHGRKIFRRGIKVITCKYHPYGQKKILEGKYHYKEVYYYRIVMEAQMNNLSIDKFINILKYDKEKSKSLKYLNKNLVIHHKNGDYKDNCIKNLQAMTKIEHDKLHGTSTKRNFSNQIPYEEKIISIDKYGEEETYDIVMNKNNPNFVANDFIVHNSGKTTLCLHLARETQKRKGIVYYIDSEHKLDRSYAKKIGVNVDDLFYKAPYTLEEVLESINKTIETVKDLKGKAELSDEISKIPILIVVDSVSISTRAEKAGELGKGGKGEHARLVSYFLRQVIPEVSTLNLAILFVCQLKSKINIGFGAGRGPKETFLAEDTLRYHCTIGLRAQRISTLKDSKNNKYADIDLYMTTKNSCIPPFQEAEIELHYGKGFNYYASLTDALIDYYGAIVKGSWYSHDEIGKWQGKDGIRKLLKADPKLQTVVNKIIAAPSKMRISV